MSDSDEVSSFLQLIAELATEDSNAVGASQAVTNLDAYITRVYEKKDVNAIKSLNYSLFSGDLNLLQTLPQIKDETVVCHNAMEALMKHLHNFCEQNLHLDLKQFNDICEFCLRFCRFGNSQMQTDAYRLLAMCLGAKIPSRQKVSDEYNSTITNVCKFVVENLFDSQLSKHATLLSEVIEACNCLCFLHPQALDTCKMSGNKTAYEYYRNALSSYMRTAKTLRANAGCLMGMRGLLTHFRFKDIEGSSAPLMRDCAAKMWSALEGPAKIERYDVVKASLKLLGEHAMNLARYMTEIANAPKICEVLLKWCKHNNRDVRSAALTAFDTWTSEVKKYIKTAEEVSMLNTTYTELMEEQDLKCISLSFRGRGSLAWHAAKYNMSILDDFLPSSLLYWNLFLSKEDDNDEDDKVNEILPEFVMSIANIFMNLPQAVQKQDCSWFISDIVRYLFSSYPSIMQKKQFLHERAWFLLYCSIMFSSASNLSSASLVPVALPISIEPRRDENHAPPGKRAVDDLKDQPCFSLVHLWTSVLNSKQVDWIERNLRSGGTEAEGGETERVDRVQFEIYNQLLSHTITLLNSLDLSIGAADGLNDQLAFSQAHATSRRNKKDFDRYINLTDLCSGVLDRLEKDESSIRSKLNIKSFTRSLLLLAMKDTTLCGLLKLLTKSIRICLKSEELRTFLKDMVELQQFSNEVSKACEQEQEEDDLFSRLEFILAIPMGFVDFPVHFRVLRRSLSVGFAEPSLLDRTLEFVEGWIEVDRPELQHQLMEICRLVELHVAFGRDSSTGVSVRKAGGRRQDLSRRKKAVSEHKGADLVLDSSQRAIRIIGKTSHLMWNDLQPKDQQTHAARRSALQQLIKLKKGPMGELCLDKITSRISEVVSESSERQARVTFAECLHTLTCLVIGELKENSESPENLNALMSMFGALYAQVMKLSVDVTKQIKTIFQSLNEEIIKWLARERNKYRAVCVHIFDVVIQESCTTPEASRWACLMLEMFLGQDEQEHKKSRHAKEEEKGWEGGVLAVLINRVYGILTHPDASQRHTGSLIVIRLATVLSEKAQDYNKFIAENVAKLNTYCLLGLKYTSTDDRSLEAARSLLQALEFAETLLVNCATADVSEKLQDLEMYGKHVMQGMVSSQPTMRTSCRQLIQRLRTEAGDTHLGRRFDEKRLLSALKEFVDVQKVGASLMFENFLWLESLGFDLDKLFKTFPLDQFVQHLPHESDYVTNGEPSKNSPAEAKRSTRSWQAVKVELVLCQSIFKHVALKTSKAAPGLVKPLCSVFLLNCLCPLGVKDVENASKILDQDVLITLDEILAIISSCNVLKEALQSSLCDLEKKYEFFLMDKFCKSFETFGHGELSIFLKGRALLLKRGFATEEKRMQSQTAEKMFEWMQLNDGYPPEFVELALELSNKPSECFQGIIVMEGGEAIKTMSNLYLQYRQTYDRYFIWHIDEIECTSSLKTLGMLNNMLETCSRQNLWPAGRKLAERIAFSFIVSREALQSMLSVSRLQLKETMVILRQSLNFLMDIKDGDEDVKRVVGPFRDWACAVLDAKPFLEEFKVLVPLLIDLMQFDCERTHITTCLNRYLRLSLKTDTEGQPISVDNESYFKEILQFVQGANKVEVLDIIQSALFQAHQSNHKKGEVDLALDGFFAALSDRDREDAIYFALQKCQTISGRQDNGLAYRWALKEVCARGLVTMTEDSVVSLFQNCYRMITNCVELLKGRSKFTDEEFNKITCTFQVVRMVYLRLNYDDIVNKLHCLATDSQNHISKDLIVGLCKVCSAEISSTDVNLAKDCYRTCHSTLCAVFARTQSKSELFHKFLIKNWSWNAIIDTESMYEPRESAIRDFQDNTIEQTNEENEEGVQTMSLTATNFDSSQEVWKLTLSELEEEAGQADRPRDISSSSLYNFRIDGDRLDHHECMYALAFALLSFEQKGKEYAEKASSILSGVLSLIQDADQSSLVRIFFLKFVLNYCKLTRCQEILKGNSHKIFEVFFHPDTYMHGDHRDNQAPYTRFQMKLVAQAQRVWFSREELAGTALIEEERRRCWSFLLYLMSNIIHRKVKPSKSNPSFSLFIRLLLPWRKYATAQELHEYLLKIKELYEARDSIGVLIGFQFQRYIYLTEIQEKHQSGERWNRLESREMKDEVRALGTLLTTFMSPSQESNAENRKYISRRFLQPSSLLCGAWLGLMVAEDRSEVEKSIVKQVHALAKSDKVDQLIVCIRSLCERYPKAATWAHSHLRVNERNVHEKLSEKLEIKMKQVKHLRGLRDLREEDEEGRQQRTQLQEVAMDAKTAISKSRETHLNFFRLLNGRPEDPLADAQDSSGALLPTLDPLQLVDITRSLLTFHDVFCKGPDNLRVHYFMTLHDVVERCANLDHKESQIGELRQEVHKRLLVSLGDPKEEARSFFLRWYKGKIKVEQPLEMLLHLLEDFSRVDGKNVGEIWLRSVSHFMLESCEAVDLKLFDKPLVPDLQFQYLDLSLTSTFTATWVSQSQFASRQRRGIGSSTAESTFTLATSDTMEVEEDGQTNRLMYGLKEWQSAETLERLQKWRRQGPERDRARALKGKFASNIFKIRMARIAAENRQRKEQAELKRRLKISMCRRYMHGEVPFIEINQGELVTLLKLAASHDDQLCNIVILEYINALVKKTKTAMEKEKEQKEQEKQKMKELPAKGKGKKEQEKGEGMVQKAMVIVKEKEAIQRVLGDRGDKLKELVGRALCFASFQSPIVLSTLLSISRKFDVPIDSRSIVNICKSKSECIYDGILTLENAILKLEDASKKQDGKRKHTEVDDSDWLPLSALYAMLEESDMEIGIYEKFLSTDDGNRQALKALNLEVDGRFEEAISCYDALLSKQDVAEPVVEICERGMEESLLKSLKFADLESWIVNKYEPDDESSQSFDKELLKPENWKSLRNFLKCQVGHIFTDFDRFGDARSSKVSTITSLISAGSATEGPQLQTELSYEHALARLLGNPKITPECEEAVRRGISNYCSSWQRSVNFGEGMKSKKIVELQRLIEFDEYLHSAGDASELQGLLAKWRRRQPKSTSRSQGLGWDQILMSRYILLRHAESRALGSELGAQGMCDEMKMQISLKLAAMAARYNNQFASKAANQLTPQLSSLEYWCRKVKVASFKASSTLPETYKHFIEKMDDALTRTPQQGDENMRWRLKGLLRQGQLFDHLDQQDEALRRLELARHESEKLSESGGIRLKYLAKTHFHAAVWCDKQLKMHGEASDKSDDAQKAMECDQVTVRIVGDDKKYLDIFLESLLSAITFGFDKAKDYLPRFLEIVEMIGTAERNNIASLFESRKFSVQPFIQWLPQIIFFHKKFSDDNLSAFLIRELSLLYPQAVYLAFQTEFGDKPDSGQDQLFNKLKVNRKTLDDVRGAFRLLQDPLQQIMDVEKNVLKKVMTAEARNQMSLMVSDFKDRLEASKIRKELLKESTFKSFFNKIAEKKNRPNGLSDKQLREEWKQKFSDKETVTMYSTYLSEFEGKFDDEEAVIIPYQVIGVPTLLSESQCPKLMSLDDRMTFFSSLRRPVRISLRGSDGKDHRWIVKGGEDLRQDERLQQVFGIMNRLMASDANCSKKSLSLITYSVVTLSKSMGLLEYVEGTRTLEQFIETRQYQKGKTGYLNMYLDKTSERDPLFVTLWSKSMKHEDITQKFNRLIDQLDQLNFRNSLLSGTRTAKEEYDKRSKFIKTLAAMNACHYIVGIGDRHLGNSLVLEDGRILGIDFGHAFGSATIQLPIPELVPFRMTPQFMGVLYPVDAKGSMKHTMARVLRTLRDHRRTLLHVLSMFAKDPVLAKKEEALQCIHVVRDKLDGKDPFEIVKSEIERNKTDVVRGLVRPLNQLVDRAKNAGGCSTKQELNPFEQVDALLQIATSRDILARAYYGWGPFA